MYPISFKCGQRMFKSSRFTPESVSSAPSPNILCKPRLLLTGELDLERVRMVKRERATSKRN